MADLQLVIDKQTVEFTSLKALVETYKTDITTLKADNVAMKKEIDTLKADYVLLKADVTKLKGGTTIPDPTPTVTGLTASIVGTSSMPLISGTNTVNVVLFNNTTKALYASS